jgi:radical SAM protein with 4Fe4S-binding SPASM domain
MRAYRMPVVGNNKSVIAVPGRGYYALAEPINTPEIQDVDFPVSEDDQVFILKRNEYFIHRRKEYVRNSSPNITKLFYLITPECNGKCSYCYAHSSRDKVKDYDSKSFLSYLGFVDACKKFRINLDEVTDIQLLGGEPLLYLDEIISLAVNHPNIIVGVTTGLMVDESILKRTMETLCTLDNVSFSISIDPYYPDYARVYEGKQFYEGALQNIKKIDSATNRWGIRATISDERQDINNLEHDIRTAIGDQVSFLSFTVDLLMGEAAESQTVAMDKSFQWAKDKIDLAISSTREQLKDIEVFESVLPYPVKQFFAMFRHFGLSVVQQQSCCDVVTERLAIDYKGTLNYCAESPMTEYADDWRYSGITEEVVNRRVYAAQECHTCDIFQYCGGVCFFNYKYYGINKLQCKWWEHSAVLAMYALFNYKEKYEILNEETLR